MALYLRERCELAQACHIGAPARRRTFRKARDRRARAGPASPEARRRHHPQARAWPLQCGIRGVQEGSRPGTCLPAAGASARRRRPWPSALAATASAAARATLEKPRWRRKASSAKARGWTAAQRRCPSRLRKAQASERPAPRRAAPQSAHLFLTAASFARARLAAACPGRETARPRRLARRSRALLCRQRASAVCAAKRAARGDRRTAWTRRRWRREVRERVGVVCACRARSAATKEEAWLRRRRRLRLARRSPGARTSLRCQPLHATEIGAQAFSVAVLCSIFIVWLDAGGSCERDGPRRERGALPGAHSASGSGVQRATRPARGRRPTRPTVPGGRSRRAAGGPHLAPRSLAAQHRGSSCVLRRRSAVLTRQSRRYWSAKK